MSEQDQKDQPEESGRHGVTQDEINSAMAVYAMPDETRLHGDQDETEQIMDGTGETRTLREGEEDPAHQGDVGSDT